MIEHCDLRPATIDDADGPRWRRRPCLRGHLSRNRARTRSSTSGSPRRRRPGATVFEDRAPDSPSRIWVAERDGRGRRLRHDITGEGHLVAATGRGRRGDEPVPRARRRRQRCRRMSYEHAVERPSRCADSIRSWSGRFGTTRAPRSSIRGWAWLIDVADHHWILGDVPCPIVRFRRDWSDDGSG